MYGVLDVEIIFKPTKYRSSWHSSKIVEDLSYSFYVIFNYHNKYNVFIYYNVRIVYYINNCTMNNVQKNV